LLAIPAAYLSLQKLHPAAGLLKKREEKTKPPSSTTAAQAAAAAASKPRRRKKAAAAAEGRAPSLLRYFVLRPVSELPELLMPEKMNDEHPIGLGIARMNENLG
jgi:hypothetical protein